MSFKRKHSSNSLEERYLMVKMYRKGSSISAIAKQKGIPRQTVSGYCQKAEQIINQFESGSLNSSAKRTRVHNYEDIDEPLLQFFKLARDKKIPISGEMILEKAQQYARELNCPDAANLDINWINRWKKRNSIVVKKLHGEAATADKSAIIDWKHNGLAALLKDFEPENILNCDETGLFFR